MFAAATEIVFDDSGAVINGSHWEEAREECAQAGHQGGFHHNKGVHSEEHFAEWQFTVERDGCYFVEEFHPSTAACGFELSRHVPVQVDYCKGQHTAGLVDQSVRGGQWNVVARLPFFVDHKAAIRISFEGLDFRPSGVWAVDAFRLRWHSESCSADPESLIDETTDPKEEDASLLMARKGPKAADQKDTRLVQRPCRRSFFARP